MYSNDNVISDWNQSLSNQPIIITSSNGQNTTTRKWVLFLVVIGLIFLGFLLLKKGESSAVN